jgi:hypothetical protein
MLRKLFIIMAIVSLAGSGLVLAQGKTNLSGTWNFDEAKSDPAPAGRGGGGGGGRGGGRGGAPAATLVIMQTAAELNVESKNDMGSQTAVYKLDGGESTITMGRGEMKAKASWDGAKLVIGGTQSVSTPGGDFTIERKDVYSVAGNVLTIERSQTAQQGSQTRKLVYNKAP